MASDASEERGGGESYWRQWTAPPTVIALACMTGTFYAGFVVQQERMDSLRVRLELVERDYQRRDVLTETLRTIDLRLSGIEGKLTERAGHGR